MQYNILLALPMAEQAVNGLKAEFLKKKIEVGNFYQENYLLGVESCLRKNPDINLLIIIDTIHSDKPFCPDILDHLKTQYPDLEIIPVLTDNSSLKLYQNRGYQVLSSSKADTAHLVSLVQTQNKKEKKKSIFRRKKKKETPSILNIKTAEPQFSIYDKTTAKTDTFLSNVPEIPAPDTEEEVTANRGGKQNEPPDKLLLANTPGGDEIPAFIPKPDEVPKPSSDSLFDYHYRENVSIKHGKPRIFGQPEAAAKEDAIHSESSPDKKECDGMNIPEQTDTKPAEPVSGSDSGKKDSISAPKLCTTEKIERLANVPCPVSQETETPCQKKISLPAEVPKPPYTNKIPEQEPQKHPVQLNFPKPGVKETPLAGIGKEFISSNSCFGTFQKLKSTAYFALLNASPKAGSTTASFLLADSLYEYGLNVAVLESGSNTDRIFDQVMKDCKKEENYYIYHNCRFYPDSSLHDLQDIYDMDVIIFDYGYVEKEHYSFFQQMDQVFLCAEPSADGLLSLSRCMRICPFPFRILFKNADDQDMEAYKETYSPHSANIVLENENIFNQINRSSLQNLSMEGLKRAFPNVDMKYEESKPQDAENYTESTGVRRLLESVLPESDVSFVEAVSGLSIKKVVPPSVTVPFRKKTKPDTAAEPVPEPKPVSCMKTASVIFVSSITGKSGASYIAQTIANRFYMKKKKVGYFKTPGVTEYLNLSIPSWSEPQYDQYLEQCESAVFDKGPLSILNEKDQKTMSAADRKIMVCSSDMDSIKALAAFVQSNPESSEWIYIFNRTPKKDKERIRILMKGFRYFILPEYKINKVPGEFKKIMKALGE